MSSAWRRGMWYICSFPVSLSSNATRMVAQQSQTTWNSQRPSFACPGPRMQTRASATLSGPPETSMGFQSTYDSDASTREIGPIWSLVYRSRQCWRQLTRLRAACVWIVSRMGSRSASTRKRFCNGSKMSAWLDRLQQTPCYEGSLYGELPSVHRDLHIVSTSISLRYSPHRSFRTSNKRSLNK